MIVIIIVNKYKGYSLFYINQWFPFQKEYINEWLLRKIK